MASRRLPPDPDYDPARGEGRRSEDHFRQLVGAVEDYAILLLDPHGRILTWNAGAELLTGYTAAEVLGKPGAGFYTPEARAEGVPERHLRLAAELGRVSENGWCLRKDGSRFWASVVLTAVVREDGVPRCFLIIARDLTVRREMERQLRDAAERSEERFARFAQHLPGLAWIKDLEGRYVYINDAGVVAFGAPRERICGQTDGQLFPAEAAEQFRSNDQRAIASRTGIEVVEHLTLPDGSVRHSIVSKFPILDPQGNIGLVGGIAIDITERVRAEEALRQADRRKDEFLATLSHELRNPLAPLRNSLHVLQSRRGEGRAERMYAMMEQQLNRMIRLVDDLLEVSRITRGKIELRREPVTLTSVIEHAVETSRPLIDAAGHRLTLELGERPIVVDADPLRLTQVISNLLNNAAKYTREAGQLSVSAGIEGEEAVVRVRDNGLGIPADMLPRVFEMFAQVDRTLKRAQGGLGIGLSLARRLVEMHGGQLSASSAGLNQGSEFVVRLPLSRRPLGTVPATEPRPVPPDSGLRVVVVDDSQDGADTLAMVLRTMGVEARVAYDGESAIDLIHDFRPDLVLLDLGMPGMDGYEVAERIRGDREIGQVRLIALTGFGSEEERRRSRSAGFDDHCVKPVDPARLRVLLATTEPGNE